MIKIISVNIGFFGVFEKEVPTLQHQNASNILLFNHKKAYPSVFLHVCNIVSTSGTQHVLIKSMDADVVIIAIALLLPLELAEMGIGSSNGLYRINIPVHDIYQQLGNDR